MKKERAQSFVGRIRDIYEKDILPVNAVFSARPSVALVVLTYIIAAAAVIILGVINSKYVPQAVLMLTAFFKGVKGEWIEGLFTKGFIALYSVCMILAVYYHLKRAVTTYVLTYDELIIRKGLLTRKQIFVPLMKVRSVTVTSSFLGKVLRYGTIHIDTGGNAGAVTLDNVVNPNEKTRFIVDNVKVATGKD